MYTKAKLNEVSGLFFTKAFDSNCTIGLSSQAADNISRGRLRVSLKAQNIRKVSHLNINIGAVVGSFDIYVGGDDCSLEVCEDVRGNYTIRLLGVSECFIGKGTTSNGARLVMENSSCFIGRDCMLSDEVLIQTSNQHGIYDIVDQNLHGYDREYVRLNDHVWVGRRSTVLPNTTIYRGAIIAACAVVKGEVPMHVIVAGNPAKVIREGVTWSRKQFDLDDYCYAASMF